MRKLPQTRPSTGAVLPLTLLFLLSLIVPIMAVSEAPVIDKQKAQLFEDLANAETQAQGRNAEAAIWQYWFDQSPTVPVREALDAGMRRREAYDYEAAEAQLDFVVDAAPDYAEGYNQRAFVRFLREKYSQAQQDLEKTLELEADHFGALAGLYHILRIQNRKVAAISRSQCYSKRSAYTLG